MTDLDRLRRTYLRLMVAYPRWYRRERELELVTTLLDDSAPGQRRPSRSDTLNLIGRGLRARLMPPHRLAAWAVSLLAALFVALAAASGAVLIGPHTGPPAQAPAIAIATIAMNRPPDEVFSDTEPPMRIDNVMLYYNAPWDQVPAMLAQARYQLAAAGWKVEPTRTDGNLGFAAMTDHLNVTLFSYPHQPQVIVTVSRRVSVLTATGVAAAALAGLLGGWMMSVSVMHRHRRHRPAQRKQISEMALPFLLSAAVVIAVTVSFVAIDATDGIDLVDIEAPLVFIAAPPGVFFTAMAIFFGLATLSITAQLVSPSEPADLPHPTARSLT